MNSRTTSMRRPSRRFSFANDAYGCDGRRPTLNAVISRLS
jgi:hypothetical protein